MLHLDALVVFLLSHTVIDYHAVRKGASPLHGYIDYHHTVSMPLPFAVTSNAVTDVSEMLSSLCCSAIALRRPSGWSPTGAPRAPLFRSPTCMSLLAL